MRTFVSHIVLLCIFLSGLFGSVMAQQSARTCYVSTFEQDSVSHTILLQWFFDRDYADEAYGDGPFNAYKLDHQFTGSLAGFKTALTYRANLSFSGALAVYSEGFSLSNMQDVAIHLEQVTFAGGSKQNQRHLVMQLFAQLDSLEHLLSANYRHGEPFYFASEHPSGNVVMVDSTNYFYFPSLAFERTMLRTSLSVSRTLARDRISYTGYDAGEWIDGVLTFENDRTFTPFRSETSNTSELLSQGSSFGLFVRPGGRLVAGFFSLDEDANHAEEDFPLSLMPLYAQEFNADTTYRRTLGTLSDAGDQPAWDEDINFWLRPQSGRARYTFLSGNRYEGEWQDRQPHGEGTKYFAHPLRGSLTAFEGHFDKGEINGYGTYILRSGERISSFWQGTQHADTVAVFYTDSTLYEGPVAVDNSLTGMATIRFANGAIYHGHVLHGRISGTGTLRFPNGDLLYATWDNAESFVRGSVIRYVWANGNRFDGIAKESGFLRGDWLKKENEEEQKALPHEYHKWVLQPFFELSSSLQLVFPAY